MDLTAIAAVFLGWGVRFKCKIQRENNFGLPALVCDVLQAPELLACYLVSVNEVRFHVPAL